jgi:hypothetical protein
METQKIKKFELKWNSIQVNGKEVFYEWGNQQTIVPYSLWDVEVPTLKTARAFLFESEKPANEKEWKKWLADEDQNPFDLELEFDYTPSEYGLALRAELDNFDQFTMVLTQNHSKEFWMLADFDDIENQGFRIHAMISAENLGYEEAFSYLMALFHLKYYHLLAQGEESFEDAMNACNIIEGISSKAQVKARELVTELIEKVKGDEEFWKGF